MKLSCLPVTFFSQIIDGELTVADWARMGAEVGLDAIDLSVLFFKSLEPAYLDEMRRDIEAAGMTVAMVTSYPDFTHPDPAERKRQIEQERTYIEAVGRLGARMIRVTSGQAHPGLKEADGIRWALEGLRACEEAGQKAGVKLVLENHGKPGCWEYTDFDQPTHIFLALAEGMKDTSIGINFDTANPIAYGDDPPAHSGAGHRSGGQHPCRRHRHPRSVESRAPGRRAGSLRGAVHLSQGRRLRRVDLHGGERPPGAAGRTRRRQFHSHHVEECLTFTHDIDDSIQDRS